MLKENLERAKEIENQLYSVNYCLENLRNMEEQGKVSDIMYYSTGISDKAAKQIREIAIKSMLNRKRALQREFNKL